MVEHHVLCYGDSVSWGIVPGTRQRHSFETRWPGIVQNALGSRVRIIEECLNGRTTAWNDPFRPGRNGRESLLPILQSHAPIDLVILFLGTNDVQALYGVTAYESSLGANALVDVIQTSRIEPMTVAPQVLLVAPPRAHPCGTMEEKFRNAEEKSQAFSHWYQRVATERGCFFLDAGAVLEPSAVDGVHLDALQHAQFAQAVLPVLQQILQLA